MCGLRGLCTLCYLHTKWVTTGDFDVCVMPSECWWTCLLVKMRKLIFFLALMKNKNRHGNWLKWKALKPDGSRLRIKIYVAASFSTATYMQNCNLTGPSTPCSTPNDLLLSLAQSPVCIFCRFVWVTTDYLLILIKLWNGASFAQHGTRLQAKYMVTEILCTLH